MLAGEAAAKRHGLTPRARVVAWRRPAYAPRIMGIGPAPATQKLLARLGMKLGDIDVIELNEAFAAQGLAVLRELGLPDDAAREPERRRDRAGPSAGHVGRAPGADRAAMRWRRAAASARIATMCIGVGQGIAALIERV